ncbi:DUF4393 domain-containing protein [Actinomycetospora sp. TBRC 11914]|uniref:DUF4393 domain-containing protein n=1 Tax=Actinomycetospora sp. TBRC 11914 TaxID=2729387 RepID=UPI00145DAEED|nr:DUF4393 domain-containing protein [Actinomycetospora sp. TBRC 11914]NMO91811.1 DUF4393 domain-containing protein [Actinomycetospora sp. TBRC 11914]
MSLAELAKETPGLRKAAELRGQRAAVRQKMILQVLRPIARLVGVSREYFEENGEFAQDIEEKLAGVAEDDLISPAPTLAAPALQGLGFSLDEPTLKEMYLQLLARASTATTSGLAHPAFAQIIRELQPEEASLLKTVFAAGVRHPIARLDRHDAGTEGFNVVRNHVMAFGDLDTGAPIDEPRARVWIDNWARLGIATTDYSAFLTRPGAYDWVEDRPEMAAARSDCTDGQTIQIARGLFDITDFGQQFASVVF